MTPEEGLIRRRPEPLLDVVVRRHPCATPFLDLSQGSCNLKLHLSQVRQRHPLLHSQNLDAYNLILLIEVEYDARLNLLGLDDLGVIQAQIEGVRFLVKVYPHNLPLCVRSKYAVTTCYG